MKGLPGHSLHREARRHCAHTSARGMGNDRIMMPSSLSREAIPDTASACLGMCCKSTDARDDPKFPFDPLGAVMSS